MTDKWEKITINTETNESWDEYLLELSAPLFVRIVQGCPEKEVFDIELAYFEDVHGSKLFSDPIIKWDSINGIEEAKKYALDMVRSLLTKSLAIVQE